MSAVAFDFVLKIETRGLVPVIFDRVLDVTLLQRRYKIRVFTAKYEIL